MTGERIREQWQRLREALPLSPWVAAGAAAAAIVLVGAYLLFSGIGHSNQVAEAQIVSTDSSWVQGQPSLADSTAFMGIELRAEALAQSRQSARDALIIQLAAEKKAAAERKRQAALAAYRRAYALALARRKAALARYAAALRRNAILQAQARAKHARALAEFRRKVAEYEARLRVQPGQECAQPNVSKSFHCKVGRLPAPHIKMPK